LFVIAVLRKLRSFEWLARAAHSQRVRLIVSALQRSCRLALANTASRAMTASLLLHVAFALWAAWIRWQLPPAPGETPISTNWATTQTETAERLVEFNLAELPHERTTEGGSRGEWMPAFMPNPTLADPLRSLVVSEFTNDLLAPSNLGAVVANASPTAGGGKGQGRGRGNGHGNGDTFFGLKADGRSFVYVLDCSLSMNHPHDSDAKTRFKRVKVELVTSIASLTPDQEFFIIFFNDQALTMPAERPVTALPEHQRHYLSWMLQLPAVGNTDPTEALQIAMRLRPDVIYFLTDGCFAHKANEILKSIRQTKTAIHTFSFETPLTGKERAGLELMRQKKMSAAHIKLGEATYRRTREIFLAEQVLQDLAANNGGKYHVIP
jgi:hypothetical protein